MGALVNLNYEMKMSLKCHKVCHSQDDRWLLVTPLLHGAQASTRSLPGSCSVAAQDTSIAPILHS